MLAAKIGEEKAGWSFDEKPLLVFWETTRACPLACRHCRASAIKDRLPGELTTDEGYKLIDQVKMFGEPFPTMIFTGGDCMIRPDLFDFLRYAISCGVRVAVAPAVSPLLNHEALRKFKSLGVHAISVSLDGANQETHDQIRGYQGVWQRTVEVIKEAASLGLRVQVNTAVMKSNVIEFADIFHLVRELGAGTWEVFFLIRTGRGAELEDLETSQYEDVAVFLNDTSFYGVRVRTSEGPFFRRVALQRTEGRSIRAGPLYDRLAATLRYLEGPKNDRSEAHSFGTRDGLGIVFVAYNGEIFPSGFLPVSAGNIRRGSLKDIYRLSPVFRTLRDPRNLKGKCGICEYRDVCGGSRARAYASLNDMLREDPACVYEPKGKSGMGV